MDVMQKILRTVAGVADPGLRCVRSGVDDPGCKLGLRSLAMALALLLAPALAAQPKADPVIYPRGSAAADAPASAASGGSNASLILAGVLLAGAGGWWLWLKRRDGLRGPGGKTTRLNIAESRSLGSRQYLVVADYDGKKFLLGVCPGSIELLTPLDGEKIEKP
jgi:flagellar protein FliO/FliZ